jgi:hypothetical protein
MKASALKDLFIEEGIRAEKTIWLGGQLDEDFPDDVEEVGNYNFNEKSPEQVRDLFLAGMPAGSKLDPPDEEDLDDDIDAFMYWIGENDLYGHLVQFAVPVRQWGKTNTTDPDNFWTSGFGIYNTDWFYTEKFDKALFLRAKAWADKLHAKGWERHLKDVEEITITP